MVSVVSVQFKDIAPTPCPATNAYENSTRSAYTRDQRLMSTLSDSKIKLDDRFSF